MNADPVYLSPELLEKVWMRFIREHKLYADNYYPTFGRRPPPKFSNTSQYTPERKRFETWLFEQGAHVRRINKKYYLEFALQDKATFFGLLYL